MGRGLVPPPRAGVEGHKVLGTREAEARSRQAPTWASISGQYDVVESIFAFQKIDLEINEMACKEAKYSKGWG